MDHARTLLRGCTPLSLYLLLILTTTATAHGAANVRRDLPAVRFNAPPVIDGDLSDACWQGAAKAEEFTDSLNGDTVADQTVALLGYDDEQIYVAFHARDAQPEEIVARETKRGTRFRGEDYVGVTFDFYTARRWEDRSFFLINPLGTQYARLAGERAKKLEWEGKWLAAAKRVADGWTAEAAIPWSIVNYPSADGPTRCGLNFNRYQQRGQMTSWWSNIGQDEKYELEGNWVGVRFPRFRPQLSLLPFSSTGWQEGDGGALRSGVDLRATLTPSMTLVGTVNPDFDNVEGAIEGVDFSYGARFVPDVRPFFLDGGNFYNVGSEGGGRYFHSRQIGPFDTGLKLFGKVTKRDTIAALGALDFGRRADWVVRGRHEFGFPAGFDLALINRDDENISNRVAAARQYFRRGPWNAGLSWAGSWVDNRYVGDAADAQISYSNAPWYVTLTPHYIRPGFRNDLGFIPFTDYKGVNFHSGYYTEYRRGPFTRAGIDVSLENDDHYDGRVFRRQKQVSAFCRTRNDLGFNLGWEGGRFEEFEDSVFNARVRINASNPFRNISLGISHGRRAGDPITFLSPSVVWRFNPALTLGLSSQILTHTENREQHILTFNYDFSPERGIVGRFVAQTGGTNAYVAYRQSGYGGVETFLILGDPNATSFRPRIVAKVVWAK